MYSPEDNATFTQSAVNTSMLAPLAESLDGLCEILEGNLSAHIANITAARQSVRSFGRPEYIDLYDLVRLLRLNSTSDALNLSAQAVMEAIGRAVISEAHGKDRQGAHGISIYFPAFSYTYKQPYGDLALSQQIDWCRLLLAYYNTTGRMASEPPLAGSMASGGPNDAPSAFQADTTGIPRAGQGTECEFNVKDRY
jgi:hypothetical protein